MPHSCKFSDYGCKMEHTKTTLECHEKDCGYRLVNCVDLACQTQVPMAQLMEHMKKDHEREDFVHTESNTYRSHFIVQSSDFTREIMWISDHIVLGKNQRNNITLHSFRFLHKFCRMCACATCNRHAYPLKLGIISCFFLSAWVSSFC